MTEQLILLRDLIHERTGLFFPDNHGIETISRCLTPRLVINGCESFGDYSLFLSQEGNAGEWGSVVNELTIKASSFYRHRNRTGILARIVVPRLLSDENRTGLKIWSAGCSTGEEPLSIAIALGEAGWFDRAGIEIYASDASPAVVEKARRGVYTDFRMCAFSAALREKYFKPVSDGWQVDPGLQGKIGWSVANLVRENEVSEHAGSDIIFCRNVFIYFSDTAIDRALRLFGKYMPPGGYLFTDEGDYFTSIISRTDIFEEQKINGISIWKKRAD